MYGHKTDSAITFKNNLKGNNKFYFCGDFNTNIDIQLDRTNRRVCINDSVMTDRFDLIDIWRSKHDVNILVQKSTQNILQVKHQYYEGWACFMISDNFINKDIAREIC